MSLWNFTIELIYDNIQIRRIKIKNERSYQKT